MSVVFELDVIDETKDRFIVSAIDLMGATAEYTQQVARVKVRKRSEHLHDSIEVYDSDGGLTRDVGTPEWYGIYNEYGTGRYATGPGGSSASEIPWVYYDEYLGQFFTTYGLTPQPFMRPAYEEGKTFLRREGGRWFQ